MDARWHKFWFESPAWLRRLTGRLDHWMLTRQPRDSVGPTIEQFYEQDERRRRSAEYDVVGPWVDSEGRRYRVYWLQVTGEVYAMVAPDQWWVVDAESGAAPAGLGPNPTVRVLGEVGSFSELKAVAAQLSGHRTIEELEARLP